MAKDGNITAYGKYLLGDKIVNSKKSASQRVYRKLFNAIVSGVIRPGDRLLEEEISNNLDVSRTPVRQALRVLERERLVKIIPYRGAVASTLSYEEAEELFEVSLSFEEFICGKAAQNASEADIDRLKDMLSQYERSYVDRDYENMQRLDYTFHIAIAEIAGNKFAQEIYTGIRAKMNIISIMTLSLINRPQSTLDEHRGILDALAENNEELAKEKVRNHIEQIAVVTLERLKKRLY